MDHCGWPGRLLRLTDSPPGIDASSYSNGWIRFPDRGLRSATHDRHDELAELRPEPQRDGVREGVAPTRSRGRTRGFFLG